ncbi:MAG: hypothetical protein HCA25_09300 [Dolichospermum sp. DET50]|nr:hypothetical protein [Dolichospermum sp. DET66]MBS3037674.1 hypothetical protein [Dolichospermum sp. DET50]QSX69623.1 MAG: hypothetical protein EZY12_08520 [Dolichospermum sp. DET69]
MKTAGYIGFSKAGEDVSKVSHSGLKILRCTSTNLHEKKDSMRFITARVAYISGLKTLSFTLAGCSYKCCYKQFNIAQASQQKNR